jgi:hypothetical protein
MSESTDISSYPEFSDEPERYHHEGPSSQPAPVTPCAEIEDTLMAESMNIQGPGLSTTYPLSLHPVSPMSVTLNLAPTVRISAEEPVKPLGPTPNVLIVEDNPINVCNQ